ncbi:MAG TPA: hypothetical protein VF931_10630 [Steroidobacteraceae bacterium]
MNAANAFYFIAGALAIIAVLFVVYPWLAGRPRAQLLSSLPRWIPLAGGVAVAGALVLYLILGSPQLTATDAVAASAPGAPGVAAQAGEGTGAMPGATAPAAAATPQQRQAAGSMDNAVAGLERRLAGGGGSDGDWELLAKSYEFLGRPDDAAAARRKQLPASATTGSAAAVGAAATGGPAAAAGLTVRGEVVLDDALRGKVPAGLTLFILAKSVASPGPPVAILRTTTGSWPVRFQLDDTQSMLPDRKLSTAGLVTIEARTSKTGQAMPAPGDFQGVTAQLDPHAGKPVRVVIQRVIG